MSYTGDASGANGAPGKWTGPVVGESERRRRIGGGTKGDPLHTDGR